MKSNVTIVIIIVKLLPRCLLEYCNCNVVVNRLVPMLFCLFESHVNKQLWINCAKQDNNAIHSNLETHSQSDVVKFVTKSVIHIGHNLSFKMPPISIDRNYTINCMQHQQRKASIIAKRFCQRTSAATRESILTNEAGIREPLGKV